jgi:hypothetical protein
MISTIIALGTTLAFSGGDAADFAQQYASATGMATVVAAYCPVPPLEFANIKIVAPGDADRYGRFVAARIEAEHETYWFRKSDQDLPCQAFRPKALPYWFAPGWSPLRFSSYETAYPFGGIQDLMSIVGKGVSSDCRPGAFLSAAQLEKQKLTKPVKVHWLLRHYRFVACGKFPSEKEYLRAIAFAIGGKFGELSGTYVIGLDPAAYRNQFIAYYQDKLLVQCDPYEIAYSNFRIAALKAVSDGQILQAMAEENSSVGLDVPQDTPLGRASSAIIEAYLYEGSDPKSMNRVVNEGHRRFLALGDMSRPYRLSFEAQKGPMLYIWAAAGDNGVIQP